LSKESYVTRKELEELTKAWAAEFQTLAQRFQPERVVRDSTGNSASGEKRESENMPLYKCTSKDCTSKGYSTEDIEAFIDHKIEERTRPKPAEEAAPPKKRHESVEEYLNCPECYPKFEKAILENPKFQEKLKQEGYVRKERR